VKQGIGVLSAVMLRKNLLEILQRETKLSSRQAKWMQQMLAHVSVERRSADVQNFTRLIAGEVGNHGREATGAGCEGGIHGAECLLN
jgi:hypothetical protein